MSTTSVSTIPVGSTQALQLNQDTKYIIIANKSPYDMLLSGFGVLDKSWVPSGTADKLYGQIFNSGKLIMLLFNTANVSPQNAGIILTTQFSSSEPEPLGSYPVSIPSQTVTIGASVTDHIVNDGNVAGTQIIEATVAGDTQSTVTLTNDAQFILGDAAHQGYLKTHQIDTDGMQIFGSGPAIYGGIIFGNGGWQYINYSSGAINLSPNPQSAGVVIIGTLKFLTGQLTRVSSFTGSGTGTFNHNLTVTPNYISITPHFNGSQTQGYDSENSTNVHITSGAGGAWGAMAWQF